MQLTAASLPANAEVIVVIHRRTGEEKLLLHPIDKERGVFLSADAPAEPHEFVPAWSCELARGKKRYPST
jgi:hypothetical protein